MNGAARILIVEDEPLSRDVIARRLQSYGYQTVCVNDGLAAVEWLKLNIADLVLMDISMPRMNGLDATVELRKTWSPDALPIIIVSASVDSDDIVEGLDVGANDYVVKPINFRVLVSRIRSCLHLRATVSLLVEAERQRVMIESLKRSAVRFAEPMSHIIERLDELTHEAREPERYELMELVAFVEQAIEVIERIRDAATGEDVPYLDRLRKL
ncbi:MAG: response regulator [Tepidisphaeraceae bacterium]